MHVSHRDAMRRFREHTFKLSEFDLSSESVCNIFVIKVFHQYEHRNEWVNWDGDTNIVHRGGLFDLPESAPLREVGW